MTYISEVNIQKKAIKSATWCLTTLNFFMKSVIENIKNDMQWCVLQKQFTKKTMILLYNYIVIQYPSQDSYGCIVLVCMFLSQDYHIQHSKTDSRLDQLS